MPVQQPVFAPGAPPGQAAQSVIAGGNAAQSWMNQNLERQNLQQQMQQRAAVAQQNQQKWQMLQPLMQAQAQTQVVTQQSALQSALADQQALQTATAQAPQALDEFNNLMQETDPDHRDQEMINWMGKYGQYAHVAGPMGQAFQAKQNTLAGLHQDWQRTKLLNLQHIAALAKQKEIESGQTTRTGMTTQAGVQEATIRAQGMVDAAKQRTDNVNQQVKSYESMADRELKMAASTDDDAEAAQHRSRASMYQIEAHQLLKGQGQPQDNSGDPANQSGLGGGAQAPAGKGPAIPDNTLHVSVDGKQYPVFTDPKGRHAYWNGQSYIPVTQEQLSQWQQTQQPEAAAAPQ
jgi:hypothetical protein